MKIGTLLLRFISLILGIEDSHSFPPPLSRQEETELFATSGRIVVQYNGSFCKYTFDGEPEDYGIFFNRNGRYCAYKIDTDRLHIEMGNGDAF